MGVSRKYPSFYKKAGSRSGSRIGNLQAWAGAICLLLSILLLVGLRETPSLCSNLLGVAGAGIGVYMLTVGSRQSAREGKHWLGTARKAEVPILGRKYQEEDDLGAYFIHPRYYNGPTPEAWFLELDMHSCQGQPGTAPQPVQVEVSHQQYDAYAGETTATVYYSPADPNVFLLEDELRPLFGRQYRK